MLQLYPVKTTSERTASREEDDGRRGSNAGWPEKPATGAWDVGEAVAKRKTEKTARRWSENTGHRRIRR